MTGGPARGRAPRGRRRRGTLLVAAGVVAALAALPLPAGPAGGQTIPLRPTPTAEGGSFAVAVEPTAPAVATPAPVRTAPPSAGTRPPPAVSGPAAPPPAATAASPERASPAAASPAAPSPAAFRVEHVDVRALTLPQPPAGWRLGETVLRTTGAAADGTAGAGPPIAVRPSARDLAAAGGLPDRLVAYRLAPAGEWVRVEPQSRDADSGRIEFGAGLDGVYAVLAPAPIPESGDYAIDGGRFFRAPDGEDGFSVVDGAGGAAGAFWTVYGAVGGEAVMGRPASRRFVHGEELVQVFERGYVSSGPRTAAVARPAAAAPAVPPPARQPEPAPLPARA